MVLILSAQRISPKYRNTINKAVDYIVRNMEGVEDPYAIAITTYALHLAQHPTKEAGFNLLESKARTGSTCIKNKKKSLRPLWLIVYFYRRAEMVEQDASGRWWEEPVVWCAECHFRRDDGICVVDLFGTWFGGRFSAYHALADSAEECWRRLRFYTGNTLSLLPSPAQIDLKSPVNSMDGILFYLVVTGDAVECSSSSNVISILPSIETGLIFSGYCDRYASVSRSRRTSFRNSQQRRCSLYIQSWWNRQQEH